MEGINVKMQKVLVDLNETDVFIISHALSECCENEQLVKELSVLFNCDKDEVTKSLDKMIEVLTINENELQNEYEVQ